MTSRSGSPSPFIDARLVQILGPVADEIGHAIHAEVADALRAVLGELCPGLDRLSSTAVAAAPWAFDLGRGLHWHDRCGSPQETTIERLTQRLAPGQSASGFVTDVDITWTITHGRYADQIFGTGAVHRPSNELREIYPWFDAAVLGYRIDLVLEYARLHETLS